MQPIEILRGFNRGDEKARNAVYDRYHDALLVSINKKMNGSSGAEDLVSDTFVAFYKSDKTFDDLSQMRNLLFKTAKNLYINYLKKQEADQRKYEEYEARHPNQDEDFYADINFSETMALLFKCIDNLPNDLKIVFRLRHFQNLSNDVVAEQLNIAGQTVANRFYKAKQKLRWEMEKIQRFTIYLLNLFL